METVSGVGKGYYNYYEISSRNKTKDNKAAEVWYDRDLSSEEINSNNSNMGCSNRESQGADICRKVADRFQSIAAANRAKYSDPEEMKSAVWAKYQVSGKYNHLSFEQRTALARTEIIRDNMEFFYEFDIVKVYYDNGRAEVARILSSVFNALLDNVEFRRVISSDYRLFQVADLICTLKLAELKMERHLLSKSEVFFFEDERTLKKNYLKTLKEKEM